LRAVRNYQQCGKINQNRGIRVYDLWRTKAWGGVV